MGSNFASLLNHADTHVLLFLFGHLLEADGCGEACRSSAHDTDIVFHHLAGIQGSCAGEAPQGRGSLRTIGQARAIPAEIPGGARLEPGRPGGLPEKRLPKRCGKGQHPGRKGKKTAATPRPVKQLAARPSTTSRSFANFCSGTDGDKRSPGGRLQGTAATAI
mmetsp:Transcript_31579/g.89681  ORF Transcript_31579/g.89681 Transcript_31579/m.89681 type:complete len:163 (+) Transcript_31579:1606-2094(+)